MFCPKCATQNLDGASFCRGCGANISLIPQALTGQMMQAPVAEVEEGGRSRRRRRDRGEVTLDQAFKNIFMGIGFLLVAIALSRTIGQAFWFWFLLPAFSMMGTGIAQYIRVREREKRSLMEPPPARQSFAQPPRAPEELRAPVASVTEGTTRHLGVEAPTRQFDANERK
ncbi:MAG TPA: zinc ribbon domain-containing protein [Pyrinomonadaceae bacterium]|nr:zinc ribbon domain-containing protein [Pyrinomonadaceae bacterium]